MQQQSKMEEGSELSPSFSCYSSSSDTLTSAAIAKVIREEHQAAQFHEFGDFDEDNFEFSLVLSDEEISAADINSRSWTVFPVFNRDLLVKNGDDYKSKDNQIHPPDSESITSPLQKLFIDERVESSSSSSSSSSCSSSEADESESPRSKTYCVWRPKAEGGNLPIKKSSSTGSGSKRWSIRYLLRRSNSEGKEPMVLSIPTPKQRRNSGEVSKVAPRLKAKTPVHEQFYVQRRAENEVGKRKSYLPYRRDLVGFFSNVNGMGKMLPPF